MIPVYFITFIVSSIIAILTKWAADGMPHSSDGLAKVLTEVFNDTKYKIVQFFQDKKNPAHC